MTDEGGMRKRGGAGVAASSMYKEESLDSDDDEGKPLVGGAPLPAAEESPQDRGEADVDDAHPSHPSSASAGTVSKATFKMGMVIDKIREIELDDVYRYWSVFQTWLADVPSKLGTRCPPLAGLGLTRPPELSQEQLEKLDRWCEDNVAVSCSAGEHGDLLRRLWDLSYPGSDVKPGIPDP